VSSLLQLKILVRLASDMKNLFFINSVCPLRIDDEERVPKVAFRSAL
jgi:hypothetical protein